MKYNSFEMQKNNKNRFRIYFAKIKFGYQILCQIEVDHDSRYFFIDHGKVYSRLEAALEYAVKYVMHNKKYYDFMIDCQVKENIK